jgi:hypothetical protein
VGKAVGANQITIVASIALQNRHAPEAQGIVEGAAIDPGEQPGVSAGGAVQYPIGKIQQVFNLRKILIAARNEETGKDLSNLLNSIQGNCSDYIKIDTVKNISKDVELVINTTPIGMKGRKEKHFITKNFFPIFSVISYW